MGDGSLKKDCKKTRNLFRAARAQKVPGFCFLMVMRQHSPYSEGEDGAVLLHGAGVQGDLTVNVCTVCKGVNVCCGGGAEGLELPAVCEALSSAAQTAADNDGLTAALPRRVLFCEMLGRMRRRTGLFCALAHRAKKKFLFIVLRWVGRNFVKCVEYYRKICERRPMNIP